MVNHGMFTLAFAALAVAQPHGKNLHHRHQDLHQRDVVTVTGTVTVDQYSNVVKTVVAEAATTTVMAGAQDEIKVEDAGAYTTMATSTSAAAAAYTAAATSSSQTFSAEAASQTFSAEAASSSSASYGSSSGTGEQSSDGTGVDTDFPDGTLSCDTFPSAYGAITVPWMNIGGWSGIQKDGGSGSSCDEGALCSYACPAGYSKAQWPSDQPTDGESRGGLLCKGGKLHRTRSYSKLCEAGMGTANVVNNLSDEVAVCRTDYPGSEDMVVPLSCSAGDTSPLTVPNAASSYQWQGKQSSAQYYVNPKGVPPSKGCTWGTAGGGYGNWSPMVLGAGYSDGKTWLSIAQNQLNASPLNFNIKIKGDVSQTCKYENGVFTGGDGGCTVAVNSGTAEFVFY